MPKVKVKQKAAKAVKQKTASLSRVAKSKAKISNVRKTFGAPIATQVRAKRKRKG